MAGAALEVDFQDGLVQQVFSELIARGDDLTPAFDDIGEYLRRSHWERWDDEQAPDGTPWEPLSPRYAKRKKKGQDSILLLDSYLRDTLAWSADTDSLEFGTNLIYGATHQFGDDDRNIPARPFLGLSDDDEEEVLEILRDYFALAAD